MNVISRSLSSFLFTIVSVKRVRIRTTTDHRGRFRFPLGEAPLGAYPAVSILFPFLSNSIPRPHQPPNLQPPFGYYWSVSREDIIIPYGSFAMSFSQSSIDLAKNFQMENALRVSILLISGSFYIIIRECFFSPQSR